jgi:hypothetical protein
MTITKKEAKKLGLIKQLNSSEEVSLIISVPDFQIGSSASSKGTLILKGVGITQEPKTGYGKLYAKSADGKLYYKNPIHNSGEEVDITGGSITVTEEDNSPSVTDVTTLKFSNGTLTDNGDGTVSVSNSAGTASNIAADNITTGDAATTIETTSGNVTIDSNAGSVTVDGHTGVIITSSNTGHIALNAAAQLHLNSTTGDIKFQDGGADQLWLDLDGTSNEIIMQLMVDSDDFVFKQYDGTEVIRFTDGGMVEVKDNLELTSDSSVLKFGAGDDVTFAHDGGTGMDIISAGDLDISSTAGSITTTVVDGQTVTLGKASHNSIVIAPHGTASSELLSIVNVAGTTDGTDGAGALLLGATAGGIGIEWADGKDLWAEGGRFIVTVNEDAAGAIKLHADAGTSQTIQIVNDAGTTDGSDDAGAIELSATAGGIGLAWADGKDLWAEGGRFIVTVNEDAADAIKLHADAGTSQTIQIVNDAGTSRTEGAAAIQLLASTGGINIKSGLDAALAILLTADGGTSETIKIHADQGTSATSIELASDAGGISILAGNTTHGVKIATGTSGVPVTIGHTTSEVTVADNLTVTGDLTVNGATSTIDVTNLTIEDPLIKLNKGNTASPTLDLGFIFSRGNGSAADKDNRVLVWDESEDEFAFGVAAEEDGTTSGNISISAYSDVTVGKLLFDSAAGDYINITSSDLTIAATADIDLIPGGGQVNVTGDVIVSDDITLNSDAAVFNMGAGNDFTITHDGTTGATLAGTPISINSTGNLTLDSSTEAVFNEGGVDVDFRIESIDETHMIFVEGSSNRVSIGDSTNSPAATLEITNASDGGVPLLQLNNNDTDEIAIDINATNINANVIDITADAVTTAAVINVSADALTTGTAFSINDNSSSTSTRKTVQITQNNASAIAATALKIQSDGGITGIELDKNYRDTDAASAITGIKVDMDKTGASATNNNIYGITVDCDNTTATDGANTMIGVWSSPTLTHAADAGTSTIKGVRIIATGGSNGTSTAYGLDVLTVGADTNIGLNLNVEDGGTDIKCASSADTGDYFSISTTTHGATTITTVDDDAAAANLTFTIDGSWDANITGAITIDSLAGTIGIGVDDVDQNINIGTQGERTISIGTGAFADDINIGNATGATALDLDAGTGGVTIDTTGAFSVDAADASNITVASGATDENLTLSVTGATASSLILSSAGTGTDAIDINATAGGIDIDANGTISIDSAAGSIDINVVDGQTVKIGLNGAVEQIIAPHGTAGSELYSVINTAGTTDGSDAAGSILLSAVAGGIGLAWADSKDLWAEGGQFVVTANHDTAAAIKLHADAGSSQTIQIINDEGTTDGSEGAGAIDIEATVGGISLHAADDKDIAIEAGQVVITANHNTSESIKLHADAGANQTIQIINDAGTAEGAEGSGAIDIEATVGGISLHAADDKDISIEAGQLVLTANHDAADSIKLHADAGTSQTIQIVNDAGTTDGSDDAGAIELSASAGGIGLAWADDKDLWAEGGQFVVTANHNTSEAIKLHADVGANQTIQIINDEGTADGAEGSGAIDIEATVGGISLHAADDKDIAIEAGQVVITANHNTSESIKLHADAGANQTIQIINDAGTTDGSEGAGAIDIEATVGGISLHAADDKDIAVEAGQVVLTANHDTAASIKLHADAGSSQTIQILNDEGTADGAEGSGAIDIEATVGGISLHAADDKDIAIEAGQVIVTANHNTGESIKLHADAGADQTIQIINDEGTTDGSEGAGAIDIEATVGGISLHAADDKDIAIEAGQVIVTANHDTAGAIKLHADAGTSQTILIQNDAGTGAGAVNIAADAGGVTIDAGLDITLDADGADIFFKDSGTEVGSLQLTGTTNMTLRSKGDLSLDANGSDIFFKDEGTEVGSLQLTGTTNMTLRSKGDLSLDSNAGKWLFEDEGIHVLQVTGSNGDVTIETSTSDKDLIFKVNDGGIQTEIARFDASSGSVGIRTDTPKVALDVHYTGSIDPTDLDNDTGGGEVVYFGTNATVTAGKLYYLDTNGAWDEASAASGSFPQNSLSGSSQLLAIALGTNTNENGMLIRGFFDATTYLNNFSSGQAIAIHTASGKMDTTFPSGSGDFIRIAGYCTNTANVIYFNPAGSWVEIA